jgi:3-hydroxyisobutyrate dehydrogenase
MHVAVIGLGRMGGALAGRLLGAGYPVTVHDIRREAGAPLIQRGASWAETPAQAAAVAHVVLTSLPGPDDVEQVALGVGGIVEGASAGSLYIDLSTNAPSTIRRIHDRLAVSGIDVLDCPVSGGVAGAEAGRLQMMVGGDEGVFERARPFLDVLGHKVTYMGPIGNGMVAKLVHNSVTAATYLVLAEALSLGVKAGVPAEALVAVLQGGGYGQGAIVHQVLPERVLRGRFDGGGFSLQLSHKDVRLALELAKEFGVPMDALTVTEASMAEAMRKGWGDRDSSVAFVVQELRAGVNIRTEEGDPPP